MRIRDVEVILDDVIGMVAIAVILIAGLWIGYGTGLAVMGDL